MNFLNPSLLWLLAGLLIPLAIHLWSRKKVKVIKIGSTRFIPVQTPRQTRNMALNEIFLLLLRSAILVLLVLILAGFHLFLKKDPVSMAYVIEPGLIQHIDQKILETAENGEVRWLSPGLPEIDGDSTTFKSDINYWEITAELSRLNADSVVVFTRGLVKHLQGKRPLGSPKINWIILNPDFSEKERSFAISTGDSLLWVRGLYSEDNTQLERTAFIRTDPQLTWNEGEDSVRISTQNIPVLNTAPLAVQIYYDDSLQTQARYLEAAFRALDTFTYLDIPVSSTQTGGPVELSDNGLLVWMSESPAPTFAGTRLLYQPEISSEAQILGTSVPGVFYLTSPINNENLISENLAEELLVLLPLEPGVKEQLRRLDRRQVIQDQIQPRLSNTVPKPLRTAALIMGTPGWLIILVLLCVERVISKYRKQ